VSYEVFRDWAVLHQDALSITRWLLMEKSTVSLSSDFDAPTFNQTLAGVTHCMLCSRYQMSRTHSLFFDFICSLIDCQLY